MAKKTREILKTILTKLFSFKIRDFYPKWLINCHYQGRSEKLSTFYYALYYD